MITHPAQQGRPLRLAIVTDNDARSNGAWSGSTRSIVEALERHFELVHVERHGMPKLAKALDRMASRLTGGRIELVWQSRFIRLMAGAMRARVARAQPDVVVSIASAQLAEFFARDWPVVVIGDATGPAIVDYYPEFATMSPARKANLVAMSRRSVQSAMLCLYPSEWARQSAIRDCGKDPADALHIAWGHNLRTPPKSRERTLSDPVRLLFIGFDWKRKGGPLLLDAFQLLNRDRPRFELDVIGSHAPSGVVPPEGARFHGPLNKSVPADVALFQRCLDEAHLLVLPTQAECYGIVFAEAAAHGIPSIAVRTGGVPSAMTEGVTGLLVEPGGTPEELAEAILRLADDPAYYAAMSRSALAETEVHHNWAVWGEKVAQILPERFARFREQKAAARP